jgi:hypothetical protein
MELEWALAGSRDVLAAVRAFYDTDMDAYRAALRAAGFDPLGGG